MRNPTTSRKVPRRRKWTPEAPKAMVMLADSWEARLDRMEANLSEIKAMMAKRETTK